MELISEQIVEVKMIKRVNVRTIIILPLFIDPEKNVNKFYQDMGFY